MEKRIIIDFDNTMGIKGCDVDDGLALLFLLGSEGASVEAVCTTYGNSSLEAVHANTERLFNELALDIPVYRGAACAEEPISDAARFLAACAAESPGSVSVLASGSLTNLKGAALVDPKFFDNVAEIAVMGGITESLVINRKIMDELNLSCDPQAALAVLGAPCPVSIATSQNCLPAFFSRDDLVREFGEDSWLYRTCDYWFADMDDAYDWGGFTCWDIVAAACLVRPDLFVRETMDVTLYERLLSVGYLEAAGEGAPCATVAVPRIADPAAFVQEAIAAWRRALDRLPV